MNCLSPSILSCDFTNLGDEIRAIDEAGAQYVHIDVMDGHFVPNISLGIPVVKSIRNITDRLLDVHLMIDNPEEFIGEFAHAGADIITIHAESTNHLDRAIEMIHEAKCVAGVALNPATPVSVLKYVLPKIDMVLLMSVNPGFGGQKFIPYTFEKLKDLVSLNEELLVNPDIEIDGGVNLRNAKELLNCGANILVAGSAVFSDEDSIEENVRAFLDLME